MTMELSQLSGTPPPEDGDLLLGLPEVASRLGVSKRSVWRLVASSDLAAPVKVGRCTRWFVADLQTYLDRLRQRRDSKNNVVANHGANHEDQGVSDADALGDRNNRNTAPRRRLGRSS
jgi:predicted DNA-binding transcriptional regulator AlpA